MFKSALMLVLCSTAATAVKSPKHVIFYLIDDYGFADASYKAAMYKGTAPPPTPNIDSLANGGVRLESYYVNKLCSPTRTALQSGRYAYTIGMDDGVIVDGQDIDLPLNLKTIADHLKEGGWHTSAYGKWDCGMTAWGSTPTCRGYDHYNGFYSAASHYYDHTVGNGYDYRNDFRPDFSAAGVYTTEKVTSAVQSWIRAEVAAAAAADLDKHKMANTFAIVMHEAVHGPLQAPMRFIDGECRKLVPDDHPSRLIYCGMVRSLDEGVGNITQTYKDLGLWDDTLVIMSADNGGNAGDGGSNFPLRGNKATAWEGGVRGLSWVYGAGLSKSVKGTISHEIMHVTDWLPTLVAGAAGLDLDASGRPCATCNRTVAPLDGVDQWESLTKGKASARTEVLLDLQTTVCWNQKGDDESTPCNVPGIGALRIGKWKLIHGHSATWTKANAGGIAGDSADFCGLRSGVTGAAIYTLPVLPNTSNPWCANGWTPPPTTGNYQAPIPPPDSGCSGLPCTLNWTTSPYLTGSTWLFDVVADPFEHNDVAAANPAVVKQLLDRLNYFNTSHCNGARCEPIASMGPKGTASSSNASGGQLVWTPWRGNPDPAVCDTNVTSPVDPKPPPPPPSPFHGTLDLTELGPKFPAVSGWCYDKDFANGGVPPMTIEIIIDGTVVVNSLVANNDRGPGFPAKSGAPNSLHGYAYTLSDADAAKLFGAGSHTLAVNAFTVPPPVPASGAPKQAMRQSPACFKDGVLQSSC